MNSERSCSACGSDGTSAKSISWMRDQYTGRRILPRTSWRYVSTSRTQSCRSPDCTRRARRSHAAPSRTPVIVTTLYDRPLPCAWFAYQSRRASSSFASVGIHPSRYASSNSSSLVPTTWWTSCTNSMRPPALVELELRLEHFHESPTDDLAGLAVGQVVDEHDVLRGLVDRETLAAVRLHLVRGKRVAHNDRDADALAHFGVRNAGSGDVDDCMVVAQHRLDLDRAELLAASV